MKDEIDFILHPSSFILSSDAAHEKPQAECYSACGLDGNGDLAGYARISRIGLAARSARGIGRPTFDMFSLVWLTPRASKIVARKSGAPTARGSSTVVPSSLVRPKTDPPRMPPPPTTVVQAFG